MLYRSPTVAFPVGLVRHKLTVSSASPIASSAIGIVTIFGVVSPAAKLIAIGVLVQSAAEAVPSVSVSVAPTASCSDNFFPCRLVFARLGFVSVVGWIFAILC
ncbi:hypothetical protein [Microcoleus sp. BROC3]|uniref:hypothetical protein n=1 Tax=Microcoleus sp. BROC3 TaxID=3055323 RepID=UPI002FD3A802